MINLSQRRTALSNGNDFEKDTHIDLILPNIHAPSPKAALQHMTHALAQYSYLDQDKMFKLFQDNGAQHSSALGNGFAMMHAKTPSLSKPVVALMTLKSGIHMNAPDGKAVHLVCALLSPERDGPLHLRRLSRLTRLFKCEELVDKIKDTKDEATIRSLLVDPQGWLLAA